MVNALRPVFGSANSKYLPRLDDTYVQDEVLAIPSLGASAKVYASEARYPLPWTVTWELETGSGSQYLGAGETMEIERSMESTSGRLVF